MSFHRLLLLATALLLGLACPGCDATASPAPTPVPPTAIPATSTPAPRPTLPGTKFDVGGYELYIDCKGEGSPTVILEAGLDGDVVTWKNVHPEVAQFTRVCRYDRAGLAHSDYGPTPRTAGLIAQDLHILLTLAGVEPPYILVGHSFGGLLIRRYNFDFPGEVSGMIFVDSLQEDWWSDAPALLPPASPDDSARLTSFRLYLTEGWRDPSGSFEAMDIPAVVDEVRQTGSLGDLPVTVLTAGNFTVLNPGLPPDLEAALGKLFKEEQGRIAALSSQGRQVIVPDTGHDMPRQAPQVIVEAIREMLENR